MLEEAVEVGVAAYLQGDTPRSEADIFAELVDGGMALWVAVRLVTFLPLAFGRRLLQEATLSDSFVDPDGRHLLADDPVYPCVAARAERADETELRRIGFRSSEIDAVRQALDDGSRLEDLVMGPMALSSPLPAPQDPT
ncbi:MAG TPA: hypothetical protein VI248_07455 [Kineosporiaceae bacterium]